MLFPIRVFLAVLRHVIVVILIKNYFITCKEQDYGVIIAAYSLHHLDDNQKVSLINLIVQNSN